MDLSIVIVNWNTRDLLEKCLESVLSNLNETDSELWVVDNGSIDDSVQMVSRAFPQVKLIQNTNSGFGAANNLAIRQCLGRFILLLNPDTEVKPDAIEKLCDFMNKYPEAGAAGAQYLNPDGSFQTSSYPFPTLTKEFWRLMHMDRFKAYGIYDQWKWNQDMPRQVEVLQGACLLLRKDALDQVGLFDEAFFMYTEEVDLCYRLHRSGWKLFWVPEAKIVHYGGQSTRQVAEKMFLSLYQTKIIFFRKHYGNIKALLYKIIIFMASLPRIVLSFPTGGERSPGSEKRSQNKDYYLRLIANLPKY